MKGEESKFSQHTVPCVILISTGLKPMSGIVVCEADSPLNIQAAAAAALLTYSETS